MDGPDAATPPLATPATTTATVTATITHASIDNTATLAAEPSPAELEAARRRKQWQPGPSATATVLQQVTKTSGRTALP